jgi:hypothetical protein
VKEIRMGLLATIKKTLGFKQTRVYTQRKLVRAKYTKRKIGYWGVEAVANQSHTPKKPRAHRGTLEGMIIQSLNTSPEKDWILNGVRVKNTDSIVSGVEAIRGDGLTQSKGSVVVKLVTMVKYKQVVRVSHGLYKSGNA